MIPVSLLGAASYMPENMIGNDFFATQDEQKDHPMFKGTEYRRHVNDDDTIVSMIERATTRLSAQLNMDVRKEIDILLTNVTCLDMPFTGSGASVAYRLGTKPRWIIDVHNGGCVSFIYMMDIARSLMAGSGARTALICNVQNAAGRVFNHPQNRIRPQSAVPGDGCGVGYLVANASSPVLSLVTRSYGEYADDMKVVNDDRVPWWAPHQSPLHVEFSDSKLASVVGRGNRIVPEALQAALLQAGIKPGQVDKLITNQPNHTFLRNWRESLCLAEQKQIHTFPEHGNLFGAAIPVSIERGIESGRLVPGERLLLGGFAHAGDYAAAAVVHWHAGA